MEENQTGENEKSEAEVERENEVRETRGAKWKFVLAFFLIVVVSLGGFAAWKAYSQLRGEKEIRALAEALQKIEQDNLARAMADTYGGKTPQETLRMYIDAVEKGDYELASKYFIGDYQWKGLANLNKKTSDGIERYIAILKNSEQSSGAIYSRDYIPGGEEFIMENPIYIRMRIYPNGIWKIIEI